jgi:hypothetical protein
MTTTIYALVYCFMFSQSGGTPVGSCERMTIMPIFQSAEQCEQARLKWPDTRERAGDNEWTKTYRCMTKSVATWQPVEPAKPAKSVWGD